MTIESLPLEVFLRCISYLDMNEKIEALLVCKSWRAKIQNTDLYETVHITSNEQLEKAYEFFDSNEQYGQQVKKLIITHASMGAFTYVSLPSLFPNVQVFHVNEPSEPLECSIWDTPEARAQFSRWKDSMVDIKELGAPLCTQALLATSMCPNLVAISVGFSGMALETERVQFISNLGNVPNLTHLHMQWVSLSLEKMEELFANAPNLKTLACTDVGFIPNEHKINRYGNKPANNLESLVIKNGSFCGHANVWLHYFSKKIFNIKNLVINIMEDNGYEGFWEGHENALVKFISKCSKLEFYRVYAFKFTKKIANAMDKSGMRLKKVDLGCMDPGSDLKAFMESDQMKHIETLSTMGLPFSWIESDFEGGDKHELIKKLGKFSNIKHLRVIQNQEEIAEHEGNEIPLDLILKHMKNLESLTMDFGCLMMDYDSDLPIETKLKEMRLIEFYIKTARFKYDQECTEESLEYLEKILPHTNIIKEDLLVDIDEEPYRDFVEYKAYDLY